MISYFQKYAFVRYSFDSFIFYHQIRGYETINNNIYLINFFLPAKKKTDNIYIRSNKTICFE